MDSGVRSPVGGRSVSCRNLFIEEDFSFWSIDWLRGGVLRKVCVLPGRGLRRAKKASKRHRPSHTKAPPGAPVHGQGPVMACGQTMGCCNAKGC